MATQVATQAPVRYMQGIAVPAESVRPEEFFARTRRHTMTETSRTFAGLGGTDLVELKKSDILAGIWIKFSGQLTLTPGTGTIASTARWPYDLFRAIKLTANGASNVINASGAKLKAVNYMKTQALSDRGVAQTVNGASVNQGTLSLASEAWAVGSQTSSLGAQTNAPVELEIFVPVAEDQQLLHGAIFAATSSTDLTLAIDWEQLANLFTLTGNATASLTGTLTVQSHKFSIPIGSDGQIVVPDLSVFHSIVQSRTTAVATGDNELRIVGQGAGKSLLRTFFQTWNGSSPVPLVVNDTNYGRLAWRYAGNETPDEWYSGRALRQANEMTYNTDIGGVWGFACHDFAAQNAFRDVVDMGTTSELRLLINIPSGVTLTSPAVEYVTETVFEAGAGA